MLRKFRKLRGGFDDWHFMPICTDWPECDFVEQLDTPPIVEVCERCIELSAGHFIGDLIHDEVAASRMRR